MGCLESFQSSCNRICVIGVVVSGIHLVFLFHQSSFPFQVYTNRCSQDSRVTPYCTIINYFYIAYYFLLTGNDKIDFVHLKCSHFWKDLFIRYSRCCEIKLTNVLFLSFPIPNERINFSASSSGFKTLALVWLHPGTLGAVRGRKIDLFVLLQL